MELPPRVEMVASIIGKILVFATGLAIGFAIGWFA